MLLCIGISCVGENNWRRRYITPNNAEPYLAGKNRNFQFICLYISLSLKLSLYVTVCTFFYPSLYIYLHIRQFIDLSTLITLNIYLSVYVSPFTRLLIPFSVCPCVCSIYIIFLVFNLTRVDKFVFVACFIICYL